MAALLSTGWVMLLSSKTSPCVFCLCVSSLTLLFSDSQVLLVWLLCWDVLCYPAQTGECVPSFKKQPERETLGDFSTSLLSF